MTAQTPGNNPSRGNGADRDASVTPEPTLPDQTADLTIGAEGGRIAVNILHFARILRTAGILIGPGRVLDAIRAVETVGLARKDDFHAALSAVFVNRPGQRELFDQAFYIFWRNPRMLERMMSLVLPQSKITDEKNPTEELSPRLAAALAAEDVPTSTEHQEEVTFDAALTWSKQEVLRSKDFEKMTAEEAEAAKQAIRNLRLRIEDAPTRRFRASLHGSRIDMRATLRETLRAGGASIPLRHRRWRRRTTPVIVLCDISGSMERYARMMLHFLHAVTGDRDRVFTFLFGTRLSNITRHLRYRDPDVALEKIGQAVTDWSGGTRIGACLHEFNRFWSRRTPTQQALVLLISDGLDRDGGDRLSLEAERLARSCRRLIWLNPLLRYEGFEAKAQGIRALLPHVDDFISIHNLDSIDRLSHILSHAPVAPERESARIQHSAALQQA